MVDRDWRIAIHEAGHAVVARKLRLPDCGDAAVAPRPTVEADREEGYARFPVDEGWRSICALLGGTAAEVELLDGTFDRDGVGGDAKLALERLRRLGYTDGGLRLWRYTRRLVRRHRGLVGLVAVKLRDAGMLDGAEIDALVFRG